MRFNSSRANRTRDITCILALIGLGGGTLFAQLSQPGGTAVPSTSSTTAPARGAGRRGGPARASAESNRLRGLYGPERANNDLLYYHLDVRVNPDTQTIAGKNAIRFQMLADSSRIQIDLRDVFNIEKIIFTGALGTAGGEGTPLKYTRQADSVFIDFPQPLKTGQTYAIDFYYSGSPTPIGRFGSLVFQKDPAGRPWIFTACEEEGAAMWWPNKDQWRDEVENMDISVSIPNNLTDVSNGRLTGKTDLGDGYTRWDWHVSYPINNYGVSLNIANFVHFADKMPADAKLGMGELTMDFWVLPEDLEKAKVTFQQAKGMIEAYTHFFGEYPFIRDGYKLVEAPYTGMEHQSAVTYGNGFRNGYVGRGDQRFDFIIIHESAHEWMGNAITAADRSDEWIHEGWANYMESLFVEYHYGKADGIAYVNNQKRGIQNRLPIVAPRNTFTFPPGDQYGKGALFLNTLRNVINDDEKWFKLLHDYFQHFKYQNILTEDVNTFFNEQTGLNLTPMFKQYLFHPAIPTLELKFNEPNGTVDYRWKVDEKDFAMPIKVGKPDAWQIITPTTDWQTLKTPLKRDEFNVALDLYYVTVNKI